MIVDCFNIYNEKEILYLRLDYLYDVVDRFVIVESLDSHSKKVRKDKYMFEENIELYRPFLNKIQYFKIDNLPYDGDETLIPTNWKNEIYQKNYCCNGIKDLQPNDWILFSDVDEIPNKEILRNIGKYDGVNGLQFNQKLFYYYVNVLQNQVWGGTTSIQKKNFTSMIAMRNNRCNGFYNVIENGGWHYSYMGGIETVYQKMLSYAEANDNSEFCDKENIEKSMTTCKDHLGRKEDIFMKKTVFIFNNEMSPSNMKHFLQLYPHFFKNMSIEDTRQIDVSYVCLIYKSTKWLKFVDAQVRKYTNLKNCEFYFVANDACPAVLNYLKDNKLHHYVHNNTEEQRKEWYINNVYRAWNYGAKMAKGKYIIFINSDMSFSHGWADKLLERITDNTCITSRLVERGILRSGTYGIERNFGNNYDDYMEEKFLDYVKDISRDELRDGGLYMPLLIKKEHMEKVGYYPEGNLRYGSNEYAKVGEHCISGDVVLMEKLRQIGVYHKTNFNSVVYHFQQGEMLE